MKVHASLLELSKVTVSSIVLTGDRLKFPAWVNVNKFSSIYKDAIYRPELTTEKAFYIALSVSKRDSAKGPIRLQ